MSFALPYIVLGYITLLGFIDASPVSNTLQDPSQDLPEGYTYTPGVGTHKIHSRLTTWNMARRTCDDEGAYLGIINSIAEANAVTQLFNHSSMTHIFVGLHDLYEEDDFVTIHGEPVARTGFSNWGKGEPDDINNEDCVLLSNTGTLHDTHCTDPYGFVCELPDVQSQVLQASR